MRTFRVIALTGALLLATGTACSGVHPNHSSAIGTVGSPSATSVAQQSPASAGPTSTGGANPTPTATKTTASPAQDKPRIVSFTAIQQPVCPVVPTVDAPFSAPGKNVILRWKAVNVPAVSLSLDGPHYFDTAKTGNFETGLATSGELEVPFNCNPADQPTTTHTYTLDTEGPVHLHQTISITKRTSP
jgi:hypothetical protein